MSEPQDNLPAIPGPDRFPNWQDLSQRIDAEESAELLMMVYRYAVYWGTPEYESIDTPEDRDTFRDMVACREVAGSAHLLAKCCLAHGLELPDGVILDESLAFLRAGTPRPESERHKLVDRHQSILAALTRWEVRAVLRGETVGRGTRVDRLALENAAIAMLMAVGPNVSKIAKEMGVPRATLYGWSRFREVLDRTSSQGEAARNRRRGGRDRGDDFYARPGDD